MQPHIETSSNILKKANSSSDTVQARLRRYAAWLDDRGIAAIEFAATALPFFVMTLAIFEVGILFFEQTTLNYAVSNAARIIRTGQTYYNIKPPQVPYTLSPAQLTQIKQAICDKTSLPNCMSQLYLNIQTFTDINSVTNAPIPQFPNPQSNAVIGGACSIQLIQVFYPWNILVPINYVFAGNKTAYILSASTLIENEPFVATPCAPLIGQT